MAAKNSDDAGIQKGSKYPYYPLDSALKLAAAVKDLGGARTPVKKSLLAKQLSAVENSASFAQGITSAKVFGVIDGHGDYSLTEASKRYFFPTTDSDKSVALLDIFSTPTAFAELLKRFDGDRLPTREILGNILHRDLGIPESWKDRVAALFSNSAQSVGVIDAQGFLRFDAAHHGSASPATPPEQYSAAVVEASKAVDNVTARVIPAGTNEWNYSLNGKSVRVSTPDPLDPQLWQMLDGYVRLLKPKGMPPS